MSKLLHPDKTEIAVILIWIIVAGALSVILSQDEEKQREQKDLKRENRELGIEVRHNTLVVGKYADSISDEMLRDFYPQATDLDSLRRCLKEGYERYQRTLTDGLCY